MRFVLDGEGRRREVRDHFDQVVLSFDYQEGRLVSAQDRSGCRVRSAYAGDRLTQVTDAAGAIWRSNYDGQGRRRGLACARF